MKKVLYICLFAALFTSCEQLAEEETPVCKRCWSLVVRNSDNFVIDTPVNHKICAGDVIAWQNFEDEVGDSTTTKYECEK